MSRFFGLSKFSGFPPAALPDEPTGLFGAMGVPRPSALGSSPPALPPIGNPINPLISDLDGGSQSSMLARSPTTPPVALRKWMQDPVTNTRLGAPDVQFWAISSKTTPQATNKASYRVPPPELVAHAQADQRATGIPASFTIAQRLSEGGWDEHGPPESNNYWGIKEYDPSKPRVGIKTTEYVGGKPISKWQYFKRFATPEEGWAAHRKLLTSDPRYAKAMSLTADPDAFTDAAAKIYAPTNPYYAQRLKNFMRQNHLYQYNVFSEKSK